MKHDHSRGYVEDRSEIWENVHTCSTNISNEQFEDNFDHSRQFDSSFLNQRDILQDSPFLKTTWNGGFGLCNKWDDGTFRNNWHCPLPVELPSICIFLKVVLSQDGWFSHRFKKHSLQCKVCISYLKTTSISLKYFEISSQALKPFTPQNPPETNISHLPKKGKSSTQKSVLVVVYRWIFVMLVLQEVVTPPPTPGFFW